MRRESADDCGSRHRAPRVPVSLKRMLSGPDEPQERAAVRRGKLTVRGAGSRCRAIVRDNRGMNRPRAPVVQVWWSRLTDAPERWRMELTRRCVTLAKTVPLRLVACASDREHLPFWTRCRNTTSDTLIRINAEDAEDSLGFGKPASFLEFTKEAT